MKKLLLFFAALLINVYPQKFIELKGLEDAQNKTHLFYRVYENKGGFERDSIYKNIYHLDLSNNIDTLFLKDYELSTVGAPGTVSDNISDYAFINNDPSKYVACGKVEGYMDLLGYVLTYNRGFYYFRFLSPSSLYMKDENTFYFSSFDSLRKTTNGGESWFGLPNTSIDIIKPIALDRGKLYFSNNNLLKYTTDDGVTSTILDQLEGYVHKLFFEQNENNIYRQSLVYEVGTKFYRSKQQGTVFTWEPLGVTEDSEPIIFVDKYNSGYVYKAEKNCLYKSNDFGSSFMPVKWLPNRITGVYVKPGGNVIYLTAKSKLYSLSNNTLQVIKELPADKRLCRYHPLQVGTKWVYSVDVWDWGFFPPYGYSYEERKEVLKDTLMSNGKQYRKIFTYSCMENKYQYQRYDTLTGRIYEYHNSIDSLVDDLNIELGDTIVGRLNPYVKSVFYDEGKDSVFGGLRNYRKYRDVQTLLSIDYKLVEDIGITNIVYGYDKMGSTTYRLKGFLKNGVVFGDTTFTDVENEGNMQPKEYRLEQNFPNPFNPVTNIRFTIPNSGNVKLLLYDILGNKVAEIVNEYRNAGTYTEQYNAGSLSSGVYFYTIKCNGYSETKKMSLLK